MKITDLPNNENNHTNSELNWIEIDSKKANKKSIVVAESLSDNIYTPNNGVLNYEKEEKEFDLKSESFDKFYNLD